MKKLFLLAVLFCGLNAYAQVGIGTNTPNAKSLLELKSTTQGLLPPRMTPTERTALAPFLNTSTTGMLVLDSATGKIFIWSGSAFVDYTAYSGVYPISVNTSTNQISIAAQSNFQPYLVMNYCIALQGIFPSRSGENPFVGEIECFAFNFAPIGWAQCDGQLMAITQNTALFSLIGTYYGGNGTSNFALPNLQGRMPVCMGQGIGLSNQVIGEVNGSETVQ